MKKRNPYVASLHRPEYRTRVAKNAFDREKQRDKFDRSAKHKGNPLRDFDDLNEELQIGDNVEYVSDDNKKLKGKKGLVKNPLGPAGMVGAVFDGQYTLVDADKLKIIEESLQTMRDLARLDEMKFFEVTSGVRIPVSLEEQEILDRVDEGECLKGDLDERQQEVARQMVTRGLLKRTLNSDKRIVFRKNKEDIRRD